MVHFAAPTTSCASIFSPIANLSPCRLIGGACHTLKKLAKKIARFVAPIFTKFVEFISSYLPSHSSVAPERIGNAAQSLSRGAVPSALRGRDIAEQAVTFLRQRMDNFNERFPNIELGEITPTVETSRLSLARLMILDLFKDKTTVQLPLPNSISVGIGANPSTFGPIVHDLRGWFNQLTPSDRDSISHDFIQGNSPYRPTRPYINPEAAIDFMSRANEFVRMFLDRNATFAARAESVFANF